MENQVPKAAAKERFDRLLETIQDISREKTKGDEGKIMDVLVEEPNSQGENMLTGRLSNNLLVHFQGNKELIGRIIKVKLKECKGFYYMGEPKDGIV